MKNKALKFFTMLLIGCIPLLIYSVKWNSLVQELQPWAAWFTVIATALSPLIAIQVTRYLDEMKAKKERKIRSFYSLMAYRQAGVTDYNYLSEFNLVPVIFEGDKNVIDAFGEYHKALSALSVFVTNRASEIFNDEYARLEREKNDRQAAFLLALAASIGVSIPKHVITDQSWWPSLYGNYQSKVMGACDSIVKVEAQLTKAIIKIEEQLTKTIHSTESQ